MVGMIDDTPVTPIPEELLLSDKDFPPNFVNKQHPDDYVISDQPITKEYIFHEHEQRHPRLILRCSVKLSDAAFCAMSFVLDTGAPKVYLSDTAKTILTTNNLYMIDNELEVRYLKLLGRKYRVEDTPEGHAPANIIGVKTLCRWGLELFDEPNVGYCFKKDFDYLEV